MLIARTLTACLLFGGLSSLPAQSSGAAGGDTTAQLQSRMQQLMRAMDEAEIRIQAQQADLAALRRQILTLQAELPQAAHPTLPQTLPAAAEVSSSVDPVERQEMLSSQIETLDQIKVESVSKYPVRVYGSVLLNGFVNSTGVDQAAAPSISLGGQASTGLSVQQTSLGLVATGPHLLNAVSSADVNVDFFATAGPAGYGGGVLRLRTAHAALDWKSTQAFFAYDRPIISPYRPESLVAAAVPELAWSGNLWSWNPQIGVSHTWGSRRHLRTQAALIDVADPGNAATTATGPSPSLGESSHWPGVQGHVALMGSNEEGSASIGVGGYYSPHRFSSSLYGAGSNFTAWASTLDLRVPLRSFRFTASAYRGQALGGLGGGGYRDYVYRVEGARISLRALDDVGGWAQLHQTVNERFSWNVGLGIDNPFAQQLRTYPGGGYQNIYRNVARNRTVYANVLYSPRAYLVFSAEYRNLRTAPIQGPLWTTNVAGLGAAYRF